MTHLRLFHLLTPSAWDAAVAAGEHRPASLADEGFVHFSGAEQVEGTANLLYADVPELIVVEFDPNLLGGLEVLLERAPGTDQSFPHVYGPIPASAAVAVHEIVRDGRGQWRFSPGGAGDAASPGR